MAIETLTRKETSIQEVELPKQSQQRNLGLDALLILITIIWGSTFLIVKNTEKLTGPFTFLALCYGTGTILLACIFHKRLAHITRSELIKGAGIGTLLFTAYALQYIGLQYTLTSKAGFITGLYVPFVVIFAFFFLHQKPAFAAVVGIVLSILGLALISFNDKFNLDFGLGEALVLGCAMCWALYFVSISKFGQGADIFNLAIVELALTSLLSLLVMPIAHETFTMQPLSVWVAILYMGVIDIAFCLVAVNWVQKYVSNARSALIYSLEPMWVALFGYFLAGESLSLPAKIGCGLIFLGMIVGKAHNRS